MLKIRLCTCLFFRLCQQKALIAFFFVFMFTSFIYNTSNSSKNKISIPYKQGQRVLLRKKSRSFNRQENKKGYPFTSGDRKLKRKKIHKYVSRVTGGHHKKKPQPLCTSNKNPHMRARFLAGLPFLFQNIFGQ